MSDRTHTCGDRGRAARYTPCRVIFSPSQVGEIRRGATSATLLPLSGETIKPGRVKPLRRLIVIRDGDGTPTGEIRREQVYSPGVDGSEAFPVKLTIVSVQNVSVAAGSVDPKYPDLTGQMARFCGYRSTTLLREQWFSAHPRQPFARYVTFLVGDHRDSPIFMNRTGAAGGDYTANRHRSSDPDVEAVPPRELDVLLARQKTVKKRADASKDVSSRSLAEIAAKLEAADDPSVWRQEKWVIEQRLERAERKIRLAR